MIIVILKRLIYSIPVLLALTLVLFLALKLVPGDVALIMAGEHATADKIAAIRETLRLNDPWYIQYGIYLQKLVFEFDLGRSLYHDEAISTILATHVPATLELGFFALVIAIPIGVFLGIVSAVYRNSIIDRVATATALAGVSMPIFWLALVLTYFFSVRLGIFPTAGRLSDEVFFEESDSFTRMYIIDGFIMGVRNGDWSVFTSALHHIVLPAVALSTIPMAHIMRMTRASFLEVLGQDYIRTAKAKGVSQFFVVMKHAFRNASLQIVTIIALQAGRIFGGAVITETMFSWPGLGKALIESISTRDFPMVQSGTLFVGTVFVLFNLLSDILYGILDPRVRGPGK